MRREDICLNCGKKFVHYHNHLRKCCSKKCRKEYGYKEINAYTYKCTVCGKEYQAYYKESKYCSRKCRQKDGWNESDPSKRKVFTCKFCRKEFEEWSYRNPSFCSRLCSNKWSARQPKPNTRNPNKYVTKKCKECGKKYQTTIHQIKYRGSSFCSRECMGEAKSKSMKGENNPNYVNGESYNNYGDNWERQKRKAKKRDNHSCQHCGYKSGGDTILDVHHIKPFREFYGNWKKANKLSNLVCLCRICHIKEEQKIRNNS